ncbi:MAG: CsbD family protein [Deltaproteobacteria bacterium]|nr:CsbD family protein [Deltaproteobacteria bacterium]
MNWEQVNGNWEQVKGALRQKWGKLTDDDLETAAGSRQRLVGKIQERYGDAKEEAQQKIDRFIDSL